MNVFIDLLAGMSGGITAVLIGHPLDTIKTNMQLYPKLHNCMCTSACVTSQQTGFRNLYVGLIPALFANAAENAILFGSYGQCQDLMTKMTGNSNKADLSSLYNSVAGSITSILTSLVLCPSELVKIKMQSHGNFNELTEKRLKTSLVIKETFKANGFKGMYRGLGCTMLREFIGSGLFFGSYEQIRKLLKPIDGQKEDCSPLATMAAGSISAVLTWIVTYPIDLIKARVQISKKKTGWPLIRDKIKNMGFRGMYTGIWPTLLRTIPVNAILMFSVEFSKKFYKDILINKPSSNDLIIP